MYKTTQQPYPLAEGKVSNRLNWVVLVKYLMYWWSGFCGLVMCGCRKTDGKGRLSKSLH